MCPACSAKRASTWSMAATCKHMVLSFVGGRKETNRHRSSCFSLRCFRVWGGKQGSHWPCRSKLFLLFVPSSFVVRRFLRAVAGGGNCNNNEKRIGGEQGVLPLLLSYFPRRAGCNLFSSFFFAFPSPQNALILFFLLFFLSFVAKGKGKMGCACGKGADSSVAPPRGRAAGASSAPSTIGASPLERRAAAAGPRKNRTRPLVKPTMAGACAAGEALQKQTTSHRGRGTSPVAPGDQAGPPPPPGATLVLEYRHRYTFTQRHQERRAESLIAPRLVR